MANSIKFPIGARVRHNVGGPATVVGHAFRGPRGMMHLPVKFDNADKDCGLNGWYERNFTLIEPWDVELTKARAEITMLEERNEHLKHSHQVYYEAFKKAERQRITLAREQENLKDYVGADAYEKHQQQIDMLQSDLRISNFLTDCYIRSSDRRLEKIRKLQSTVESLEARLVPTPPVDARASASAMARRVFSDRHPYPGTWAKVHLTVADLSEILRQTIEQTRNSGAENEQSTD